MIGAFLPLPAKPVNSMHEGDQSTSNLDETNNSSNEYTRRYGPMDESRYESAKWWRRLNRWMSLAGVLVIVVIVSSQCPYMSNIQANQLQVVLVVIGLKERW